MVQAARRTIAKSESKAPAAPNLTNLSKLSIIDLVIFHDGAHAAVNAWTSLMNQPRADGEEVSELLDAECERAHWLINLAVTELRARRPVSSREATARARCLLYWAGDWLEWDECAQIVLSAAMAERGSVN
jgi:hypothetical protein